MKLRVLALAHAGPDWAEAACREYAKRLPRHWKTRVDLIAPARRSGKAEAAHWQAADSERARQALEPGAALVLLDERGRGHDSRGLAARVAHWDREHPQLCLLIGGPDGHDEAMRAQAVEQLSLSPLTLPHALARVLLLEQLYRASAINAGHPYHRD